ncbi:hypothetical protein JNUCC42_13225 [Brevibacterium sp. JNUCC-42]|nr:hypothetical protein JNUCC42_13225 [Brevibacterium sp. JNUCC-42]
MVNFDLIRSTIVQGLSSYLDMMVIESDVAVEIPPYPFITYNFITLGISSDGIPSMTLVDDGVDHVREQYMDQPTFLVSFHSYADRKADSIKNAMRAQDWLRLIGSEEMKREANLVVVDCGDIHNRDVQVGDEWERRNGFDARFRATSVVEIRNTWIEKANIRRE